MKADSIDLRGRVAAACVQPGRAFGSVAAQFSVLVSFVAKLLQRQHRSGSLAGLPHRNGPVACLDAFTRAELVVYIRQPPEPLWTNHACERPQWAEQP